MTARLAEPSLLRNLSDDEWLDILAASLDGPDVGSLRLPLFPPEETQRGFVGASGVEALQEAVRFMRYTLDAMADTGMAPGPGRSVVDFGAGWGRITRVLLRTFEPASIMAVDPLESMVSACREWFAPSDVRFETIGSWPPLPCGPCSVDLVVAYSVFSHLPENVATAWIAEFLRVLKPGGLVVGTTQSRSFIDLCEHIRHDPSYRDSDFVWFKLLAGSFQDVAGSRERFDRGEFLHEANGGGDDSLADSVYGDSLFGDRYIDQRWSHLLELVRFDDKPYSLPQACFVLRKRETLPSPVAVARGYVTRAKGFARRAGRAARDPRGTVHKLRQRVAHTST